MRATRREKEEQHRTRTCHVSLERMFSVAWCFDTLGKKKHGPLGHTCNTNAVNLVLGKVVSCSRDGQTKNCSIAHSSPPSLRSHSIPPPHHSELAGLVYALWFWRVLQPHWPLWKWVPSPRALFNAWRQRLSTCLRQLL